MRFSFFLSLVILALGLVACSPNPAPSATTSEALLTDGNLPKALVTIDMTAVAQKSPTPALEPSPSMSVRILPTPLFQGSLSSPTPYSGVFIGEPTVVGEDGVIQLPPTLAPLAVQPNLSVNAQGNIAPVIIPNTGGVSVGNCSVAVVAPLANAYNTNPTLQGLGCPVDGGTSTNLVMQRFERGRMFWRDTGQIMVMADGGTFWRASDGWNETLPVDDPALTPPEGMSQPVRGFGLAWRENPTFRDTLGWAVGPEFPLSSTWQEFERGTAFIGDNNQIYAVPSGSNGQFSGGITP